MILSDFTQVNPDTGRVFQRYAIADGKPCAQSPNVCLTRVYVAGNGDEPKPFKIEWATVKDNLLWVCHPLPILTASPCMLSAVITGGLSWQGDLRHSATCGVGEDNRYLGRCLKHRLVAYLPGVGAEQLHQVVRWAAAACRSCGRQPIPPSLVQCIRL